MTKRMTRDEVIELLTEHEICTLCAHFEKETFEMPCEECRMWVSQIYFKLVEVEE